MFALFGVVCNVHAGLKFWRAKRYCHPSITEGEGVIGSLPLWDRRLWLTVNPSTIAIPHTARLMMKDKYIRRREKLVYRVFQKNSAQSLRTTILQPFVTESRGFQQNVQKVCNRRKSAIILSTAQPFSVGRALIDKHSSTVKCAIFIV